MKVLIIGNGGREHAIAWKLKQSKLVTLLYCCPGNGGTAQIAENVPIDSKDIQAIFHSSPPVIDVFRSGMIAGGLRLGTPPEQPLAGGIITRRSFHVEEKVPRGRLAALGQCAVDLPARLTPAQTTSLQDM